MVNCGLCDTVMNIVEEWESVYVLRCPKCGTKGLLDKEPCIDKEKGE